MLLSIDFRVLLQEERSRSRGPVPPNAAQRALVTADCLAWSGVSLTAMDVIQPEAGDITKIVLVAQKSAVGDKRG